MADIIRINAPDRNYRIFIGAGYANHDMLTDALALGGDSSDFPRERAERPQNVLVTNTTIAPLLVTDELIASWDATLVTMPDGEQYKTMETVNQLYADFIGAGLDRGGSVVAFGGGVVGDTAGFAAATYMRGVRLIQIPTSLLAMVDSSVGGKVGVDLPQGKNLAGAFKQPDMVIIDPEVLRTLPDEEWRCGMAEVLKHGLLADAGLLDPALHSRQRAAELVRRAIQVKVDVVEQDPFEKGIRAHLNLGHTFAHAIEQYTSYSWRHGEAVGVGLLAAALLSYHLEMCSADLVKQVDAILAATGLPRRTGGLDPDGVYAAMATDKKWKNGVSRFVLLHDIGAPAIVEDVPRETVIRVLDEIK